MNNTNKSESSSDEHAGPGDVRQESPEGRTISVKIRVVNTETRLKLARNSVETNRGIAYVALPIDAVYISGITSEGYAILPDELDPVIIDAVADGEDPHLRAMAVWTKRMEDKAIDDEHKDAIQTALSKRFEVEAIDGRDVKVGGHYFSYIDTTPDDLIAEIQKYLEREAVREKESKERTKAETEEKERLQALRDSYQPSWLAEAKEKIDLDGKRMAETQRFLKALGLDSLEQFEALHGKTFNIANAPFTKLEFGVAGLTIRNHRYSDGDMDEYHSAPKFSDKETVLASAIAETLSGKVVMFEDSDIKETAIAVELPSGDYIEVAWRDWVEDSY